MTTNPDRYTNNPVDAVILWVDGSDPELTEKRNIYLKEENRINPPGTSPTFFASLNEIRYCLLSLLKFAPFVRNIFIVTDGQDPNLYEEVEYHFPGRSASLKIVDHKEIFRDYEKYLPTFNSTSIESMIWRIKGLSDNFIYLNDDVILVRDIHPREWFRNNKPVLLGEWHVPPLKRYLRIIFKVFVNRYLHNRHDYEPGLSFHLRQWNAALLAGMKFRYFFHCHTPHALNRKRIESHFTKNPAHLEKNIIRRFRTPDQYIMISLANHLEIRSGNRQYAKLNLAYLHPFHTKERLARRMKQCSDDPKIKYICIQNLDLFSTEEREKIFRWINNLLGLEKRLG